MGQEVIVGATLVGSLEDWANVTVHFQCEAIAVATSYVEGIANHSSRTSDSAAPSSLTSF